MKSQFNSNSGAGVNVSQERLENLFGNRKREYKSRFVAKFGDQIKHIPVADIAYFYAEDNVVFLVTKDNHRYIIDYSIEEIDNMIDPKKIIG